MANLSRVMGIFSDILTKSRFEQQPVKGNFIPRPDPKKNTTKGRKSVLLTKESPRPVPGTPGNISRPNSKEKAGSKGKKVGGLFETDGSTPDDSTYIIGMEKAKDNIYAIATAAAKGKGEKKKEEIVRALKRGKMLLKAFGIRKATRVEYEGTRYTPEDYKSKKTVGDVITEGSGHQSGYNPPPVRGKLKLRTGPHRPNVDEETYEDVERQTQRRDEGYQAGQPSGQKVGRRGDTRGYKGETADIGAKQKFMDVGRTGAPAKPTGRTAITARDQDRSRGKDWESHSIKTKRTKLKTRVGGTQSEASDVGLGVSETEAERKKRRAALSPEDRAKTPLQRLQEDDKERGRKQAGRMKKQQQKTAAAKLRKAFGVPISMPGGRQRILPINPNSEGGFFIKATWGKHGLHPAERRPKTVTEKTDGGERNFSGARGATPYIQHMQKTRGITPAILGMLKARKRIKDMTGKEMIAAHKRGEIRLNRSYRPGQGSHPAYAQKPVQRELPFSTEDRDHIAPTPEPQKPRSHGKEVWKEAALLWPTQPKDKDKGRKVTTRVGDSQGGYPT